MFTLILKDETVNMSSLYDWKREQAGEGRFPAFSTFQGWNTAGRKYACLAAGGTLYFLVIIVAANKITEATWLTETDILCITNFLRHPSGKIFGICSFLSDLFY